MNARHKNIIITGTKGKTTVAYLVDQVLMHYHKNTIRVDTTGHFVNGQRKSTLQESKEIWGLVPTVCPGRFLWELKSFNDEKRRNTVAILEASLGCNSVVGIGLKSHDVGVWTNVLEDHLGSTTRLKTRKDIADAKDFVFKRIRDDGFAVFNACDDLVCSKIPTIDKNVIKIPFIYDEKNVFFDIKKHLKDGGSAFILRGAKIYCVTDDKEEFIYDATNLPWTFDGYFIPSLINLLCSIATIFAIYQKELPTGLSKVLDDIRLDPYGGRLTPLKTKSGALIIADYAHEKQSLVSIGNLAKKLAEDRGGKTIGVVRLAYDRTDELIEKTGQAIGKVYDELVVYDKIDGFWRKPEKPHSRSLFVQKVGKISSLLETAIKKTNKNVTRILREDEALEFVAKNAGKNDVVVIIVNDNVERSIDWIKEKFQADFI